MKFGKKEYEETLKDPVAFFKYILGEPFKLSEVQVDILRAIADYPEVLVICGSKSGKSTLSAVAALWRVYILLQMENPHKKYNLNPNVPIYDMVIAPKEDVAINVTFNYIKGYAYDSWYLSQFVDEDKWHELSFLHPSKAKLIIRAQGSSSRAGRGYSIHTLIADEFAHFLDTKGNLSGLQVLNAYMPRLLPFGADARFIAITTPAGKSGVAWEMFCTGKVIKNYVLQPQPTQGQHEFRAVFQLPTWKVNPLFPWNHPFLEKERRRDPWMFEREYGARFLDVISPFFPEEILALRFKKLEMNPTAEYVIALDPSGGQNDAYGLAMGYLDKDGKVVIPHVKRWIPTTEQPLNIVEIEDYVKSLCKQFRVRRILLDQALGMSTYQRLRSYGLPSETLPFGTKTDVRIYQPFLECVLTGEVVLQDTPELREELRSLQRIATSNGYKVEAPPGGRDDMADCIGMIIYSLKILEEKPKGVMLF